MFNGIWSRVTIATSSRHTTWLSQDPKADKETIRNLVPL